MQCAPLWNDVFELPDGFYSVSDIPYYMQYIRKHETSSINPPIHICINRINNRIVFQMRDRCKLELETPEMMKLFGGIYFCSQ